MRGLDVGILRHRAPLWAFLAVSTCLILGFGVVGGFWNHGVKVLVVLLHGGGMPEAFRPLFMEPDMGSPLNELAGALTFAASLAAAYQAHRLVRGRPIPPATVGPQPSR